MNGNKPSRKVGAGGLAGALSVVVIWALVEAGINVPAGVASALTTITYFLTGYIVTDRDE